MPDTAPQQVARIRAAAIVWALLLAGLAATAATSAWPDEQAIDAAPGPGAPPPAPTPEPPKAILGDKTIDLDQTREDIIQSFRKKQVIENMSKPSEKSSAEVQEMLAEEGAQVTDDAAEHLSVGTPGKTGLSFEGDNVEVED